MTYVNINYRYYESTLIDSLPQPLSPSSLPSLFCYHRAIATDTAVERACTVACDVATAGCGGGQRRRQRRATKAAAACSSSVWLLSPQLPGGAYDES